MRGRRRHSPALVTCVAATVVLVLGLAALGAGQAATPEAEVRMASGSLSLSNSLNEAAVLTATNLKPGDVRAGVVTVANTGTLDGAFELDQTNVADTPGPFGGRLSEWAQISVEQISAGGSTVSSVYSGVLAGLGTRQLGVLGAGEARIYRFTASLPDGGYPPAPGLGDNRFQSSSVQADYVWTATADEPGGGGGNGGGGNGNGGHGGGNAFPPGQFTVRLSGSMRQRALRKGKISFGVWCSANCGARWTMSLMRYRPTRKRRVRMIALRGASQRARAPMAIPAGSPRTVTIKLSRRMKRTLRRQLRKRRPLYAGLRVFATSGNVKLVAKRRIRLAR
jgi:spore coat-associated protein N